ncbi:MAG: hypothetical protein WAT93_07390 [Pontixanthobacter sp.]
MSLDELRDALVAAGCKQDAQVIALITACIEGGIDTGSEIVSTVSGLGYDKQYVGLMLSNNKGGSAERHRWFRDAEGHYSLHLD